MSFLVRFNLSNKYHSSDVFPEINVIPLLNIYLILISLIVNIDNSQNS